MGKLLVIGLGHRARSGKDWSADYLMKKYARAPFNIHIVHWADALYEEVRNERYRNRHPLIIQNHVGKKIIYGCLDYIDASYGGIYSIARSDERESLHKLFEERGIQKYIGMDEKDSPMLQFWGTDFRRAQDPDYWVKRLEKTMDQIFQNNNEEDTLILIPDTRFINEVKSIHMMGGAYIEIERWNQDGTRYYDPSRDPNHPSEAELDDMDMKHALRPYATIKAVSGDTAGIENDIELIVSPLFAKVFGKETMSEVA